MTMIDTTFNGQTARLSLKGLDLTAPITDLGDEINERLDTLYSPTNDADCIALGDYAFELATDVAE